jgi:threonine aldolase
VKVEDVQTNMVFATMNSGSPDTLADHLARNGVLARTGQSMRLVTHLDVSEKAVDQAVRAFAAYAA